MKKRLLLLPLLALLVPAAIADPMSSITAIYVFGDSLSDGGNAFIRTGGLFPPAPYAQRISNGPVAVEYLASNAGVTLTPSLAGGTNYAVAGAATGQVPIPATSGTTDNYITVGYPVIGPLFANTGMEEQVAQMIALSPPFDPLTSLFVVWGGPNDFLINPSAATAASAVGNIFGEMLGLYGAGARNFLVPNMADLSMTPYGQSLDLTTQAGLHNLSVGFNSGLQSTLDLVSLFPGINVIRFDTFGFFNSLAANPAAFGFTNVSSACLLDPGCNPDTYLFWDDFHPTTAAADLLGDQLTAAALATPVPEPSTVLLVSLGLVGVFVGRRRRS